MCCNVISTEVMWDILWMSGKGNRRCFELIREPCAAWASPATDRRSSPLLMTKASKSGPFTGRSSSSPSTSTSTGCAVPGALLQGSYDVISSVLSLWRVTSCLCIDKIPEVANTKVSKPKRYSLSKLKRLIQTHPTCLRRGVGRFA